MPARPCPPTLRHRRKAGPRSVGSGAAAAAAAAGGVSEMRSIPTLITVATAWGCFGGFA